MKASVKLQEDGKPLLVRAKVPVAVLSLPLISSASSSGADDLSFHLRTAFAAGPSLKFSYHPSSLGSPSTAPPFSITLKSGVGLWGSPDDSPLLLSARLALPDDFRRSPSFSIQIKPRFGDFSLWKTASTAPAPRAPLPPNADPPKENCGAVYDPIAVPPPPRERSGLEDMIASGVAAVARTSFPVGKRAAVSLRWTVNLPSDPARAGRVSLPYLTVDKISVEAVEFGKEKKEGEAKKAEEEKRDADSEAMKGVMFWMNREVEELQKQTRSIKESVEELKIRVLCGRERRPEGFGELESRRKDPSAGSDKGEEKNFRNPIIASDSNLASASTSS